MYITELQDLLEAKADYKGTPITVHTGNHKWEDIVEVVYCQECNQYHIISERVKNE